MTTALTDTLAGVAIRVPRYYAGPPGIVNGGWAAGLTAGLLRGPDTVPGTVPGVPIEVTLRAPVPLEAPVTGRRDGDRAVLTDAAGTVLTEAVVVPTIAAPPAFVPLAEAERSGAPGRRVESPFPECFVCGMRRAGGLRVAVGAADAAGTVGAAGRTNAGAGPGGTGVFAGAWTPPEATGELPARYVWAALDCPTGLVHLEDGGKALLGRFTVAQHRAPAPGEPHVIVAAPTGGERRKRFSTAALYTRTGDLVAHATAIWITI